MDWRAIRPIGIGIAADLESNDGLGLPRWLSGRSHVDYLNLSGHATQLGRLQHYLRSIMNRPPPLVFHTLNLNIASSDPEDPSILSRTKEIVTYLNPRWLASDMAIWTLQSGVYQDALMLPAILDRRSVREVVQKVRALKAYFGRTFFVENPPYAALPGQMPLLRYMREIAEAADCGIVLDIGHLLTYQHARGEGLDTVEVEPGFFQYVAEVHLAGIAEVATPNGTQLLDRHDLPIREDCWNFLAERISEMNDLKGITLEQERCDRDLISEHIGRLRTLIRRRKPATWS